MNSRFRLGTLAAMFLGVAATVASGSALFGCSDQKAASLQRVVAAFQGFYYDLPEPAQNEVERFRRHYAAHVVDANDDRHVNHFVDAFSRVRNDYVRPVSDSALIDAAIEGSLEGEENGSDSSAMRGEQFVANALDAMLASLDPHSTYLDPEELRETFESTSGRFGGLGIEITMEDEVVKIVSPIEGTPAYRAGLKPGDLITHLDGELIRGKTIHDAVKVMRGRPGTDVRLTIRRDVDTEFDVTLTRAIITVDAVRWHTEGDFAYVRVAAFNEHTMEELESAMRAVKAELGPRLRGMVLDLRNNPGGLLDQSVAVADAFLDRGRVVSIRGRDPQRDKVFRATHGDLAEGLPIVVLINAGSASAAEIVAGALQDAKRAVLMGGNSFGKGSVQTISPLPVEGAIKLTTALYYAPSGRTIQGAGVTPDIAVLVKDEVGIPRESDLPGFLASEDATTVQPATTLEEGVCPVVRLREKDDRQLGCALAFLEAGTTERFLASVGPNGRM